MSDFAVAPSAPVPDAPAGAWGALRVPLYRRVWIATFVSSVGTRFDDVAGAWLMTSLSPSPLMVSLVQAAASVPVFLLAVPAGALSDVLDRRKLLIASQAWTALAAGLLAALTIFGHVTPGWLLALEVCVGIGTAVSGPAWQSIVPELVPPRDLQSAVTLNSVSVNLARTVGPALAGVAVAAVGAGYGFLANAVSFLGVIGVLLWWRRPVAASAAPAERFAGSVRAGLRYVRHSPAVRAVLFRNSLFISGASALWALMPVVARHQLGREATGYRLLLGCLGVGALAGAATLPNLRHRFGTGGVVLAGTVVFALVEITLAHTRSFPLACAVLLPGGAAWVSVLSTLNVTAQGSVPGWVRGRALSMYLLTWFGGMAVGSAAWGAIATAHSTTVALTAAAAFTLVCGVTAAWFTRLPSVSNGELLPSRHWPDPELLLTPQHDEGPVLITVEYRVRDENAAAFLDLIHRHSKERLRDGAYRWGVFRDASDPQKYLETFVVESWGEHLRQHERVTEQDRRLEAEIYALTEDGRARTVGHYLYASPPAPASAGERAG